MRETVELILKTSNDARWRSVKLSDAYRREDLDGMVVSVNREIVAHDRAFSGGEKGQHAREVVKALVILSARFLEQESTLTVEYMQAICNAVLRYMNERARINTDKAELLHLHACSDNEKALDELLEDIFRA